MLAANLAAVTGQPPRVRPGAVCMRRFHLRLHSPTPVVVVARGADRAMRRDEWVSMDDLVALTKTYALTIADWLT